MARAFDEVADVEDRSPVERKQNVASVSLGEQRDYRARALQRKLSVPRSQLERQGGYMHGNDEPKGRGTDQFRAARAP